MWDDYGPIAQPGAKSARGLTPGPSCMHVDGHPRYEGTLSVRFDPQEERCYDTPLYGDLGQRQQGIAILIASDLHVDGHLDAAASNHLGPAALRA